MPPPRPPQTAPGEALLVVAPNQHNAKRTLHVARHREYPGLVALSVYNRQGNLALRLAMTTGEARDLATALTRL